MGWGVKIGGSRAKWRLDPILGPFLTIFDHFWPFEAFFDPFWPFGRGARALSGSRTPKVGIKWGVEPKLVGPEGQVASRPLLRAIFGHFEPFGALWGLF